MGVFDPFSVGHARDQNSGRSDETSDGVEGLGSAAEDTSAGLNLELVTDEGPNLKAAAVSKDDPEHNYQLRQALVMRWMAMLDLVLHAGCPLLGNLRKTTGCSVRATVEAHQMSRGQVRNGELTLVVMVPDDPFKAVVVTRMVDAWRCRQGPQVP